MQYKQQKIKPKPKRVFEAAPQIVSFFPYLISENMMKVFFSQTTPVNAFLLCGIIRVLTMQLKEF